MDDERERGQYRSLAVRREKAFVHALAMLPIIERAQREQTDSAGGWTYRSVADWLNARDYKTVRGKVWRHQTVWDLLHIEHGQIDQAEYERREKLNALDWRAKHITPTDPSRAYDERVSAEEEIDAEFNLAAARARALGAALRGEAKLPAGFTSNQLAARSQAA